MRVSPPSVLGRTLQSPFPTISRHAAPATRWSSTEAYYRMRMIILGAPGAGKGTQSTKIIDRWGPASVIVGDLLRKNVHQKTAVGKLAAGYISRGALVPDEVALKLVEPELQTVKEQDWILDGLPRNRAQAIRLDKMLELNNDALNFVVSLEVPDSVILERIEGRWIHPGSGRVYNTTYNPPKVEGKDDVTGEPLVKRADDTKEVFAHRLRAFHDENEPLLDYYSRQETWDGHPKLISLSGETSDYIWPKLEAAVMSRFPHLRA